MPFPYPIIENNYKAVKDSRFGKNGEGVPVVGGLTQTVIGYDMLRNVDAGFNQDMQSSLDETPRSSVLAVFLPVNVLGVSQIDDVRLNIGQDSFYQ